MYEAYRLRDGQHVADVLQRAARRRLLSVRMHRDVAREYTERSMGRQPWRDMIRDDFHFHRRQQTLDTATLPNGNFSPVPCYAYTYNLKQKTSK